MRGNRHEARSESACWTLAIASSVLAVVTRQPGPRPRPPAPLPPAPPRRSRPQPVRGIGAPLHRLCDQLASLDERRAADPGDQLRRARDRAIVRPLEVRKRDPGQHGRQLVRRECRRRRVEVTRLQHLLRERVLVEEVDRQLVERKVHRGEQVDHVVAPRVGELRLVRGVGVVVHLVHRRDRRRIDERLVDRHGVELPHLLLQELAHHQLFARAGRRPLALDVRLIAPVVLRQRVHVPRQQDRRCADEDDVLELALCLEREELAHRQREVDVAPPLHLIATRLLLPAGLDRDAVGRIRHARRRRVHGADHRQHGHAVLVAVHVEVLRRQATAGRIVHVARLRSDRRISLEGRQRLAARRGGIDGRGGGTDLEVEVVALLAC